VLVRLLVASAVPVAPRLSGLWAIARCWRCSAARGGAGVVLGAGVGVGAGQLACVNLIA
jgi:hypothetical protein